jgi:hypothetical protein
MGVQEFDAIVERLSPALRAAFEAERAERWAELERLLVGDARAYDLPAADLAHGIEQAPETLAQRRWIERFLQKVGLFDIPQLIANFFPRIAAHQ